MDANTFFDLFILDRNGNLIDVPVLMRNFRDRSANTPNTPNDISDQWRLTRRFFIYDTVSGIDTVGGYLNGSIPSVVRWASTIKVKVALDPT